MTHTEKNIIIRWMAAILPPFTGSPAAGSSEKKLLPEKKISLALTRVEMDNVITAMAWSRDTNAPGATAEDKDKIIKYLMEQNWK